MPLRLSLDRSTFVTRPSAPPLVVIPSHEPIATSSLQFSVAVPRSVSFAASNVSQSWTSPQFVFGSVTAVPLAQVNTGDGCAGGEAGSLYAPTSRKYELNWVASDTSIG